MRRVVQVLSPAIRDLTRRSDKYFQIVQPNSSGGNGRQAHHKPRSRKSKMLTSEEEYSTCSEES
jgi:hypothetical protein